MVGVINISIINLFHKLLKLSSVSVKQTKCEVWGEMFHEHTLP